MKRAALIPSLLVLGGALVAGGFYAGRTTARHGQGPAIAAPAPAP